MKCEQCHIRGLVTEMNCEPPEYDENDESPSDHYECKCPVCGWTDHYDPFEPDEDDPNW